MNFNTQVCTTREQSERLLALGIKKETADMVWMAEMEYDAKNRRTYYTGDYFLRPIDYLEGEGYRDNVPAWSLHRLIALCPSYIGAFDFTLSHGYVEYVMWNDCGKYVKRLMSVNDPFDGMIDCIERLIKEEHINKEYLEETK